jgi:hypothetical protein
MGQAGGGLCVVLMELSLCVCVCVCLSVDECWLAQTDKEGCDTWMKVLCVYLLVIMASYSIESKWVWHSLES